MSWVDFHEVDDDLELDSLKISIPAVVDDETVQNAAGCIGYAVKQFTGQNATGNAYDVIRVNGTTEFVIDIYETLDDLDFLHTAEEYLRSGTPERKTDRFGPKGSRLVKGTGMVCRILVQEAVQEKPHKLQVVLDGKVIAIREFKCHDYEVVSEVHEQLSRVTW